MRMADTPAMASLASIVTFKFGERATLAPELRVIEDNVGGSESMEKAFVVLVVEFPAASVIVARKRALFVFILGTLKLERLKLELE